LKKVSFPVVRLYNTWLPELESWATSSLKDEGLIGAMIVSRALSASSEADLAENAGRMVPSLLSG